MAKEYAKVLKDLSVDFLVIGRGKENSDSFKKETGKNPHIGGIESFINTKPSLPDAVIVAVGIENLSSTTTSLLNYGIKKILVEKPGVGYASELDALVKKAEEKKADVFLAYNRRFYSSVLKAKELIKEDGGVTSFHFEFTEWSHTIKDLPKHPTEHQNWFLGNSTHVIDMAFFLGGNPTEICCFTSGSLPWHTKSSIFTGAGKTTKNALFSYCANWESPGRWSVEMLTKKHRFIFKPLETLQVQEIGSVAINPILLEDELDKKYKPGLYLQTKNFLENNIDELCSINEQKKNIDLYKKMSNY
jgi:predicted dehydrogenase